MTRDALRTRIESLVDRLAGGERDDDARDGLLADLAVWQAAHVVPYGRLVRSRGAGAALPTDVFRFTRVAAHPPEEDVRVFRTSGTTDRDRGAHPFRDLSLYDRAARAAARYALFPDVDRMDLLILAPPEDDAPDSSLSYMLSLFDDWFGREVVWASGGAPDIDRVEASLATAERSGRPVALLGTSFAFVHADAALGGRRFRLPAGSRVMQTGGFKGRAREVAPDAMRALLSSRFGVPDPLIIAEYGMTELSSQAYETTLRDAVSGNPIGPRRLRAPGWMRVTPVDPETLLPVAGDGPGILRIDDAANLDSCSAVQTSDLGHRVGDGFVVLGRAAGTMPRGCSIAADAALAGGTDGSPAP